MTALRETVRPRLGSVVLPVHGEVCEQGRVVVSDQMKSVSDSVKGFSEHLKPSDQPIPFSEQSKPSDQGVPSDPITSSSNQSTPFSNQTPSHSTHPAEAIPSTTNESLPMIITGPSVTTNTMPPPTRFLRRGGNCKYYVNGELEVARSLGDFGFKLGRLRERTWNYPSPQREMLGREGFVADVVSNVPFVK